MTFHFLSVLAHIPAYPNHILRLIRWMASIDRTDWSIARAVRHRRCTCISNSVSFVPSCTYNYSATSKGCDRGHSITGKTQKRTMRLWFPSIIYCHKGYRWKIYQAASGLLLLVFRTFFLWKTSVKKESWRQLHVFTPLLTVKGGTMRKTSRCKITWFIA